MFPIKEMKRAFCAEVALDRVQRPGWRFGGRADLLAEFGRPFQRGGLPRRRGGWFRAKQLCYRNAFLCARTDPAHYVYTEGLCRREDFSFWFPHAWIVDRHHPVVALDPTLNQDQRYRYFGIPIKFDYVLKLSLERGVYDSVFAWWYEQQPPIYKGVHYPENFMEEL